MLKNKKILLGISGGIAAYKSAVLIRLFIKAGAEVKVVTSKNALQFITQLTLETLSRNPVYVDLFDNNNKPVEHIAITDWADIFVVAPASANIIGKFANGIADDALSTTFLAFNKPVFIAPAMNTKMYNHFSVTKNIHYLKENGIHFIEPVEGELACEWEGKGRMEEPENIVDYINVSLKKKKQFENKKVLITAGPTCEMLDPVRYFSNFSSGLMGYSIAEEFVNRGASVTLISGPTNLSTDFNVKKIDITSAEEMYQACQKEFLQSDIIIMAAAVADFTPIKSISKKIKKDEGELILHLKKTTDIAAELGKKKKKNQIYVGFALETDNEIPNAIKKLNTKNFDFIVINSLQDNGAGFKYKTNKISIFDKNKKITHYELKHKQEVAKDIIDYIYEFQN